jgi:saccharopine dehydrogenase-like NADP-dependent oxidoreductase
MKILILGAGNVGRAIAYDLSKEFKVFAGDKSEEQLKKVKIFAEPIKIDVTNFVNLVTLMKKFDLTIGALPTDLTFSIFKAAIKAKCNVLDITSVRNDPFTFDEDAKKVKITIVVYAGFAPGLSNILLGHIYSKLGILDQAIIHVGGLPKRPRPPLYHQVLFSPSSLLNLYIRPARCIKNGKLIKVDPLEKIEKVVLKKFKFERFITDGLNSLLNTIKANNLIEFTVRWPGHLEKMKILKELGFFKKENLDFTSKIILPLMQHDSPDFSIMEVYGRKDKKEIRYFIYDEAQNGFTSMSRVTGFVTAVIARLMLKEKLNYGVIPSEFFGMNIKYFEYIVNEIKKRKITLKQIK